MFKLYSLIKNSSNYNQTLWMQSIVYLTVVLGLLSAFNLKLLLAGLILGWILFCVGVSICLHKYASHKTFEPKNRFIKLVLLWAATQTTLGSIIGFAAGHRQHHRDSDGPTDPFLLKESTWHNVKLWFYRFPTDQISPRLIKDLTVDADYKFFHKHYWKIWAVYPIILLIINPVYVVYFFAIPVVYCFLGMSYVTVIAHSLSWKKVFKGTAEFNDLDHSWDSKFFTILFAGEGYHHTHHVDPTQFDYSKTNSKFDLSGYLIRFLKKD
ncbi:MAG: fatty acid desaturase [Alphaproteobacteria bacterium]